MKNMLVNLILLVSGASSALADVVTKCDSPQGHAYYMAGKIVPRKDAGWRQDAISNGTYLVTRDADGKYDIIFSDAIKQTKSSREDGGDVIAISKSNDHLILLVNYPEMNVETWYFRIDPRGVGEVTVSQARYGEGAIINKHSLMRAICSR